MCPESLPSSVLGGRTEAMGGTAMVESQGRHTGSPAATEQKLRFEEQPCCSKKVSREDKGERKSGGDSPSLTGSIFD